MNRPVLAALASIASILLPHGASAQIGFVQLSLEWLVAESDLVVRASVTRVERTLIPNPDPVTIGRVNRSVTLEVRETLKGGQLESLDFTDETIEIDHLYERWRDGAGEQLWFLVRNDDTGDPTAPRWGPTDDFVSAVSLDPAEDDPRRPPPLFGMGMRLLRAPEVIVSFARAAAAEPGEPATAHEFSVPRVIMQRSGRSGDVNGLIVPVDHRLEGVSRRLIESPEYLLEEDDMELTPRNRRALEGQLRLEGVRALRHFPTDSNADVLRSLLQDPFWSIHASPDGEERKIFDVREAAAETLRAWGVDVLDPVAEQNGLHVSLDPYPLRSGFRRNPVIIRFTNRSNRIIRILRPLDGSEWSRHMPYYLFTVRDAHANLIGLPSRCGISGLWADLEWPDDYMILINPGDTYEMRAGIAQYVPADGEYTVSFEYVFDAAAAAESYIAYPDGLWEGCVRSGEIKLTLNKSP
jgi:hypothetical protein